MAARRERVDPVFRPATPSDVDALTELERAASLAALGHIFPPDAYPYPSEQVRARWVEVVEDPAVVVEVLEDELRPGRLVALVAFDADRVRHLAVSPRHWRQGHARRALAVATGRMAQPRLWVLARNHRARAVYEHLGWTPTGRTGRAEWPPHPEEIELAHPGAAPGPPQPTPDHP